MPLENTLLGADRFPPRRRGLGVYAGEWLVRCSGAAPPGLEAGADGVERGGADAEPVDALLAQVLGEAGLVERGVLAALMPFGAASCRCTRAVVRDTVRTVRVVMATFGTAGDVMPFVELGRVLEARGHEVVVVTDHAHRAAIEAHGLDAHTPIARYDPVALTSDPRYSHPALGPYRLWRDIFVPLVPEMFHAVGAALGTSSSVVLVHPWCHGALYAAEAARVPVASVAMAPITWWSAEDPGQYSHHVLPRPLQRWMLRGPVRWLLDVLFGRALVRARRALALPPYPSPFFALGRDAEVSYGLWPRQLRGHAADDPHDATICGFLRPVRASTALDAGLERFLSRGPAPIVVGVGSLLPPMAGDVYVAAREAARELGQRIVLVGADPSLADDDVYVAAHAPYFALFPRASVIVHHGGAGTLSDATLAGRPQVVVPFGNDQFDNAARVARLGLARAVPRPSLTRRRLTRALAWALEPSTAERVARIGEPLLAERCGAEVLADDLERRFAHARPSASARGAAGERAAVHSAAS